MLRGAPPKLYLNLSAPRIAGVVAPVPGAVPPYELRRRDLLIGRETCCLREVDIDFGSR